MSVLPSNLTVESVQAQIAEERARRAREGLLPYACFVDPQYQTPPHIETLAAKLEAVERGEIQRLMVFMPPRHGKSRLVSQVFPCWYLGRNPKREVVQSGYAAPIALEHSRRARDVFVTPETTAVFPEVKHRPGRRGQEPVLVERQAAQEWGTIQGGRYYAVGVGGGLTGRGADLAIIDDPVKDREEAESETIRAKVQDWYKSTFYTRLSPIGAIVVVMTRWHPDDLAGYLLKEAESGGEQWDVVQFPAISEEGLALWEERFPLEKLEVTRSAIGQHEWSALYQQEPSLRGGNLFKTDRVQWHDALEEFPDCKYIRFWDMASTEKERAKDDPDRTAGALVGVTCTEDGLPEVWIKDCAVMQHEAPERDARIIATTDMDGPTVKVAVESVAGYKDAYTYLRDKLRGRRSVIKVTVSKDKVVRATPLEPVFEAGNVHVLRSNWGTQLITEFSEFPRGSHDDMVDAVVGAYKLLEDRSIDFESLRGFRTKAGM